MSGALPIDDGVDVRPVQPGVVERARRGLAHQARHRDVVAARGVLRLSDPDDGAELGHHSPSRTQTRFCCRQRTRRRVRDRAARAAVADARGRFADPREARRHHRVGGERAARRVDRDAGAEPERLAQDRLLVRERRVQLGDVDRRLADARLLRRRCASKRERVRSRTPRPCGSMRWSMPRIHAGRSHALRARSPAASTTATAPSEIGAQSCFAQRRDEVRLGQQLGRPRSRPRRSRSGCAFASRRRASGDLRHVALGPAGLLEPSARLQRGERHRVGPERRDDVGVELRRQHLGQVARRRLAEAVDERRLRLAGLDLHPRLVERPGTVHLDVRFGDRRPGADGVERHHEREGLARQVVARSRAGEVERPRDTRALDRFVHHRHQDLDFVAQLRRADSARRERDDRDVAHQKCSCSCSNGTSGSSIGRK